MTSAAQSGSFRVFIIIIIIIIVIISFFFFFFWNGAIVDGFCIKRKKTKNI